MAAMSRSPMPLDPGECVWDFPDPTAADDHGIVCVGADLEPSTLLGAYRRGLFPMRLGGRAGPLAWWSPDPRGVMPIAADATHGFHASRSLRRARRRFRFTVDEAFEAVVRACADPLRPQGWISDDFIDAYLGLHELGWAHSVEVWQHDELVGGLYGLRLRRFFAGESMFHRVTNASKLALWDATELLALDGVELFDVQWRTDHLESLGVVDIGRDDYLRRLAAALR
jgi:leucyl/phenylalanyl-tRNA--protein transferase